MKQSTPNNAVVASDIVILRNPPIGSIKQVLVVKTDKPAFENKYALPGGKLDTQEDFTIADTAVREAQEETGLHLNELDLMLIGVYSQIGRDSRFRSISIAFLYGRILSYEESLKAVAGSDSKYLTWLNVDNVPPLAFDHSAILQHALLLEMAKRDIT